MWKFNRATQTLATNVNTHTSNSRAFKKMITISNSETLQHNKTKKMVLFVLARALVQIEGVYRERLSKFLQHSSWEIHHTAICTLKFSW